MVLRVAITRPTTEKGFAMIVELGRLVLRVVVLSQVSFEVLERRLGEV